MGKLISASVDVTKIDKSKLFAGKKGTYLNLDIWVNDEPDQYGKDVDIQQSLTKEEREANAPKVYLGKGEKKFGWEGDSVTSQAPPKSSADDESDEIPF